MRPATAALLIVLLAAPLVILWAAAPAATAPTVVAPPAATAAGSPDLGATAANTASPAVFCYSIEGMHCSGCAEAITAEVSELQGVTAVNCTFDSRTAVVYATNAGLRPDVERAITKLGYKIAPKDNPAGNQPASGTPSAEVPRAPPVPAGSSSSK